LENLDEEKEKALYAVLAEYNDLRDEIKRRIDQRTRITELMITIDVTIAGVALYTGNVFILGIMPFISAFCIVNIKTTYLTHRRLTRYIREIIEGQKLPYIFDGSSRLWISWETFFRQKLSSPHRQRASRRRMFIMFELCISVVCCAAVVGYSFIQFDRVIATVISVIYIASAIIAAWFCKIPDPYREEKHIKYDWNEIKPIRPE